MKISKREKIMLLVLGILAIGIAYYQFGYLTLVQKVEQQTAVKNDIEDKYNKAMLTISSMDSQKSKEKILKLKINEEAAIFYPTISQEHIILEMDKLIKNSGLEGGMTFEAIEVKGIESLKKSEKDKELPESSIQKDADAYNIKFGEAKGEADASSEKNNIEKPQVPNNNAPNAGTSNATKATNDATVTQIKMNVDFNGSYENVVKFLKLLGENKRKIPVYTINMSQKNLDEVKGSINMILYSAPQTDVEISKYLNWDIKNAYGKSKPFNVDSAVGTGTKSNLAISDFLISVKPTVSELPTVMIGKANDMLRTTYAYGDGNNEQNAEIVLSKKGEKYYYKYKTNNDKIPSNYGDLGNEFVPSSDNIVLDISSVSRVNSDDKSGLKLKIVNNIDKKLVMVNISGDDKTNPRVTIDGDGKNISVNQK